MNLNEAQQKTVSEWIAAGAKLSEVQSRLGAAFGIRLTYMEVRFLVDDLKLRLLDPEPPKPATPPHAPPPHAATPAIPATPAAPEAPDAPAPLGGQVSVSVDQ